MNLVSIITCITVLVITCSAYTPYYAVINVPVADLVGESLHTNVIKQYKELPFFTTQTKPSRIHQALFNEVVRVVDATEHEFCIEISTAYFVTDINKKPLNRYWTLKKNCIRLDKDIQDSIPTPISYKKESRAPRKPTITLIQPIEIGGVPFSVGTRFLYIPTTSDARALSLILYDHTLKKSITQPVPRIACYKEKTDALPSERRRELITLIRSWINDADKGFIPYVWGGCSYIQRFTGNFKEKHDIKNKFCVYTYPQAKRGVQTGFDCAGVILRAGQIVGIPFFCKNSYTSATQLSPVTKLSDIEIGDILWIPGHVMLIADLKCNTLIEARGYTQGYGKLHEISISDQFQGINSIKQLIDHLHARKPLFRLNKEGIVVATIPSFKILKLY